MTIIFKGYKNLKIWRNRKFAIQLMSNVWSTRIKAPQKTQEDI